MAAEAAADKRKAEAAARAEAQAKAVAESARATAVAEAQMRINENRCTDIQQAAIDYVLATNEKSISNRKEYGCTIDQMIEDEQTIYYLTSEEGWRSGGIGSVDLSFNENTVAYVHTHGHYVCELNNYFSTGYETDISLTQFRACSH